MPFLTGWKRRKSKTINATAAGPQTDYQLKLTINWGPGTDTVNNVFLGGNARTDFSDLRFTLSDGITLINYFIESIITSVNATVWIKIPSIPNQGTIIYIYYDNPNAASTSNPDNTFLLYDQFEFLDANKWDFGGDVAVSNGIVFIGGLIRDLYTFIRSKAFFTPGVVFESTGRRSPDQSRDTSYGFASASGLAGPNFVTGPINQNVIFAYIFPGTPPTGKVDTGIRAEISGKWKIIWRQDGTADWFFNDVPTPRATSSFTNPQNILIDKGLGGATSELVTVRKFSDPEPIFGITGPEELPNPVFFNTNPQGAEIILNGINTGFRTPIILSLQPGTYDYILRLSCFADITGQFVIVESTELITIDKIFPFNTGSISITSTPSGAIEFDGILQPNPTPLNLSCINEGTHNYLITLANFQSYRARINVVRGLTSTSNVTLLPLGQPGTGSLSVISNPSGADITLDQTTTGRITPSTMTDIPVGPHNVTISKSGFMPRTVPVIVSENITEEVNIDLIQTIGSINFNSAPSGARIFLAPLGQPLVDQLVETPRTIIDLPVGRYDFSLRLQSYNDFNSFVDIIENQITNVTAILTLQEGCLLINSNPPGAKIFLNTTPDSVVDTGSFTPKLFCGLNIGIHYIKLVLDGFVDTIINVNLGTGEGKDITTNLQRVCTSITVTSNKMTAFLGEIINFTINTQPITESYIVELRDQDNNLIGNCNTSNGVCTIGWNTTNLQPKIFSITGRILNQQCISTPLNITLQPAPAAAGASLLLIVGLAVGALLLLGTRERRTQTIREIARES